MKKCLLIFGCFLGSVWMTGCPGMGERPEHGTITEYDREENTENGPEEADIISCDEILENDSSSADTENAENEFYTANVNEFLSLRITDHTTGFCMKKLPKNALMKLLQDDGEFCRVVTEDGSRGYVMSSYLEKSEESFEEQETGTGEYTVVCREFLSLRRSPQTSAERVASLSPGTQVVVKGTDGIFAEVEVRAYGKTGYVLREYLSKGFYEGSEEKDYRTELKAVRSEGRYTYEQMKTDLRTLAGDWPEKMVLTSLGETEEGRQIPLALVGNPSGSRQILVQGAIHGREYGTARLIMSQLDYMLNHQEETYEGQTIAAFLDDVCFHVIPMMNPDGVIISQTSAEKWKANSRGVDLNRNFAAGWEQFTGNPQPAGELYKGTEPESEKESKALADYTRNHKLDATLSYHESGSVLYYKYGFDEALNEQSKKMAVKISGVSGYPLAEGEAENTDAAGYKDWAMDVEKIPSVTIETGEGEAPVAFAEFADIYRRNRDVLLAVAKWAEK